MEKIFIDKTLYSKNAVMLTIFDFLDNFVILLNQDENNWILEFPEGEKDKFDEKEFIKKLNVNEIQELIESRTSQLRETLYLATLKKGV